jgi:hypothetical protein
MHEFFFLLVQPSDLFLVFGDILSEDARFELLVLDLFAYTFYFDYQLFILLRQHNTHRYVLFHCAFAIVWDDLFAVFIGVPILRLRLLGFNVLHDQLWSSIVLQVEGERFELWA